MVLEVRRIKTTSAVVVLFDGMKVPDTVVCGTALVPCYLYRRQVDVCYACGQVGHRADVCPSSAEEKAKCRGCGVPVVSGPTGEVVHHECVPKCGLCGGPHLTGCKECKERFQVPYVVRRRRRRRRQRARKQQMEARDGAGGAVGGESSAETAAARKTSIPRSRSRSIVRSRSRSIVRSHSRSRGRSRSATRTNAAGQRSSQREASARSLSRGRSQPDKHTTWADKAKNQPQPGPPERRGRSPLRRDLAELKAAFESFKERAQGDQKDLGPLWGKAKRRALAPAEKQSESMAAVVAVQLEAAPSSVAGGVEDRLARMKTTSARMMDVLSSLEGRITVLKRPKALAKGRHEMVAESQLRGPSPSREGSAAADAMVDGEWGNLQQDLGSDHYILETLIGIRPPPTFRHRYVDWDLFRRIREEEASDYDDFAGLLPRLQQAAERAAKEIETQLEIPKMDSELAHLLEAKNGLLSRWRTQRLNRRLRARISLLNKEIEAYAKELGQQQWMEKCNETDSRMRRGSRWGLLKCLLNDKASKGGGLSGDGSDH
ncbi:hypothetical protein MTO96_017408 [Rhipicephalus appendiculatus]